MLDKTTRIHFFSDSFSFCYYERDFIFPTVLAVLLTEQGCVCCYPLHSSSVFELNSPSCK